MVVLYLRAELLSDIDGKLALTCSMGTKFAGCLESLDLHIEYGLEGIYTAAQSGRSFRRRGHHYRLPCCY